MGSTIDSDRPAGALTTTPGGAVVATPRFSVVVPCFNECDAIGRTVDELRAVLAEAGPYELIVVDDGSTDGSFEILERLAEGDRTLRVVRHQRNRGYGAALKSGIRRARADLITITDADGTYPNHVIPQLVDLAEHADMVVGARTGENVKYSKIRAFPKVFLRLYACWLANQNVPDINSGLRVIRKSVVDRLISVLPDTFSFTTTITLAMLTNFYDVRYVPIDYAPRIGKSKIRPIRDTLRFVQLMVRTGTYFAPLRVFSPVIALLFLAFVASLTFDALVLRNLTDKTVLLLLFAMNTAMFALLADMIDKRTGR